MGGGLRVAHVAGRIERGFRIEASVDEEQAGGGFRDAQGLVGGALERDRLAIAATGVGGDDQVRLGIPDAAGQALGGKPGEDHGMDGAQARAGEQGDGGLGIIGR